MTEEAQNAFKKSEKLLQILYDKYDLKELIYFYSMDFDKTNDESYLNIYVKAKYVSEVCKELEMVMKKKESLHTNIILYQISDEKKFTLCNFFGYDE
jgi:hypothetical protein